MFADENVVELTPRKHGSGRRPRGKSKTPAVVCHIGGHRRTAGCQWLAMIVESSSDAIIGKSLEGIILSWNQAAERLFGYSAAAVLGHPISILFPPDGANEVQSLLERSGQQGEHIACHETECICEDGRRVSVSLALSPVKNKAGVIVGTATIARDMTARKRAEDRLHHLALHDSLTGLPNRLLFRERVSQALAQARRQNHQVALLFIDLDRFKEINDSLGHQVGDHLLQVTASRLRYCLREGDAVARVGGDEFVVSLSALTDSSDAALVAGKIMEILREPFRVGNRQLNISGSIGIGIYPADGQDVETLMHAADTAMYHAKKKGRGTCQLACHVTSSSPVPTPCHDFQPGRVGETHKEFMPDRPPQIDVTATASQAQHLFSGSNQPSSGTSRELT